MELTDLESLAVPEVAEALRVDQATVQRELKAGRLPGAKVGRAWRVRREALKAYLDGQRLDPAMGMMYAENFVHVGDLDGAVRQLLGAFSHDSVLKEPVRWELLRRLTDLGDAVASGSADKAREALFETDAPTNTLEYVPRPGSMVYVPPANLNRRWNRLVEDVAEVLERRAHGVEGA